MPFSFTAPSVTPEQEQAERDALSESERRKLDDGIYGREPNDPKKNSEPVSETLLAQFRAALDAIPDKDAYLEASKRVPELLDQESHPSKFLRHNGNDAPAAAKQLVQYWRLRREVFGETRAFHPMTLDGAMAEDVDYFRKYAFAVAPNDRFGRPVMYFDRAQVTLTDLPREKFWRISFYLCQYLSDLPSAQQLGVVVIYNLTVRSYFACCFSRTCTHSHSTCSASTSIDTGTDSSPSRPAPSSKPLPSIAKPVTSFAAKAAPSST